MAKNELYDTLEWRRKTVETISKVKMEAAAPAVAASSADSGNANSQYVDTVWLATFGLSANNVLDYFYSCPFYSATSNNQILRAQGLPLSHLQNMVGVEYNLEPSLTQEPRLYVIFQQDRKSAQRAELVRIYYCLDGIIYQCPNFIQLLRVRISLTANYLHSAFQHFLEMKNESTIKDEWDFFFPFATPVYMLLICIYNYTDLNGYILHIQ